MNQIAVQRPLNESERDYLRAVTTDTDRARAEEAAAQAVQDEYEQSLYARTLAWREGEPPDDLGVDTEGLSPARDSAAECQGSVARLAKPLGHHSGP